jgi:hypothetical protein
VTALQVLDADIPPADKVWVLTRRGILPDRILKLFACWCAREACRITGWDNRRSLRAIEVAEQFADGLEELKGVRQGAWAANAYSAANAYASAAYNAYAAAAYATAYAAAAYAAYNAAAAAADDARQDQVDSLRAQLLDNVALSRQNRAYRDGPLVP